MAAIRRLVLDLLKPHDPATVEFAGRVADVDGVRGVNATLVEMDEEVQNIKLTIEGDDIGYGAVEDAIEGLGGSVHSVDQVACGESLIEARETPQD